jgi:hypothetical protein
MSVGEKIAKYIWEVGFDDFPPNVVEMETIGHGFCLLYSWCSL